MLINFSQPTIALKYEKKPETIPKSEGSVQYHQETPSSGIAVARLADIYKMYLGSADNSSPILGVLKEKLGVSVHQHDPNNVVFYAGKMAGRKCFVNKGETNNVYSPSCITLNGTSDVNPSIFLPVFAASMCEQYYNLRAPLENVAYYAKKEGSGYQFILSLPLYNSAFRNFASYILSVRQQWNAVNFPDDIWQNVLKRIISIRKNYGKGVNATDMRGIISEGLFQQMDVDNYWNGILNEDSGEF